MRRLRLKQVLLVAVLLSLVPAVLLLLRGRGANVPGQGANADRQASLAPLPPVPVPADDPLTPQKIELGKLLFFDPRLSGDASTSCATCHDPKLGWGDGNEVSRGYPREVVLDGVSGLDGSAGEGSHVGAACRQHELGAGRGAPQAGAGLRGSLQQGLRKRANPGPGAPGHRRLRADGGVT